MNTWEKFQDCWKNWGQSYKTFYTLGQLWLRKYLVRILGHNTLKHSESIFFDRGTISNLGTFLHPPEAKIVICIGLAPGL